ncbi:phenazine biosynthesis protein PhzF family protein [Ceratobasidium sp. AG-Ba]|nr:phenazine biosynthesis protein PhzF family protein [Ceratobasidium sp. AG-Ba]QRW06307.1 phenazine biosynthesis protein PhzF family protein [Ceratobasidium sp. AG-Ba]
MAPQARPFMQVDVFPSEHVPLSGNPLAVVVSSQGLSTEDMQKFASWTNLSETTFLLPPSDASKADYKVRIFTVARELPFAGHPTLGSCKAWLQQGGKPRKSGNIVQECGIGLVSIKLEETTGRLSFAAPEFIREGEIPASDLENICHAMRISTGDVLASRWIDNGPGWAGLILKSAQDVLDIKTSHINQGRGINWGVIGAYSKAQKYIYKMGGESVVIEEGEDDDSPHFELRAFCPSETFVEDPVTGSLK